MDISNYIPAAIAAIKDSLLWPTFIEHVRAVNAAPPTTRYPQGSWSIYDSNGHLVTEFSQHPRAWLTGEFRKFVCAQIAAEHGADRYEYLSREKQRELRVNGTARAILRGSEVQEAVEALYSQLELEASDDTHA